MSTVPTTIGAALDVLGVPRGLVADVTPRVDPDGVRLRVASRWFVLLWAAKIRAVTMPWGVYVHPELAPRVGHPEGDSGLGMLMVHELMHVEQLARMGVIRHTAQYVADYVRGRIKGLGHWEAYRQIRLEQEARAAAKLVRLRIESDRIR